MILLLVLIFILGFVSNRTELHLKPNVVLNPFVFNIGKLISYTLSGIVLGLLGFLIKINGFNGGVLLFIMSFIVFVISLSHIPIFPKIIIVGLRSHNHSKNSFLSGLSNIFVSSASLHIVMIIALAHGYYFESGLILLTFAIGTLYIPFKKIFNFTVLYKILQIVLLFLATAFIFNKGLLYTEKYLFSPFEENKTAIVPESLNNIQFLRTTTDQFNNRIIMSMEQPLNWMIEGVNKSDKIYIPRFRHKSVLGIGTESLNIKSDTSGFIYFTGNLGKGDYIIRVVEGILDVYEMPYKKVLDSGYKYGIHDVEEELQEIELTSNFVIPKITEEGQRIELEVTDSGYSPNIIILKRGVPAVIDFNVTELTEENKRIIMPSYNEYLEFIPGHNPINITDPLIDFMFYSWKGNLGGYILIVENPEEMTLEIAKRQIRMFNVNGI